MGPAMRKTILTVLGAAVLVATTVQIAAAAEHHKVRKVFRERARYENGAESAPAGH